MKYGMLRNIFLGLFCLLFFAFLSSSVQAATIYTNSSAGNDTTGDGTSGAPYKTFNKAYTESSSGDTLDLTGTFSWSDADETGDVVTAGFTVNKSLTLNGQGADETIIQASSTPNTAERRIFTFGSSLTTVIQNLTLRYGHQVSTSGSALYTNSGSLTILDSYIYQNNNSEGTEHNSEGTYMGDDRYNHGAIIAGGTTFTMRDTTVANNTNPYSAAITVSATNSEITNSTFYGNAATYESIYHNGGILVFTNNTMYETDYFVSGSFCVWGATAYLKNNLIQGTSGLEVNGTVYDGGNNIVKSSDTASISNGVNGNIVGDPGASLKLSTSLALNGASNGVPTLALLEDSIAIDAGDDAEHGPSGYEVTPPSTDQRSKARYNTTYDVGSVEYNGASDVGPYLVSSTLAEDNSYIDITFSEGLYGTSDGSGIAETSDFSIAFDSGIGAATGATVSSVTKNTGNSALEGGETTFRLHLSITGTPNGVETIMVYPTTSSSLFDGDGNGVYRLDDTGEKTLSGYFEYYVDPTGADDGSHGIGSGTDAWATIQYAVTNVPNPTTSPIRINISGNIYTTSNDDIDIDRNFTDLILQGANAATTIVQPHSDPASATVGNFDIGTSEYVTINDMTIRYGRVDPGSGINISSSGGLTLNRVYVNDCDGTAMGGVYAGSPLVMDASTISNSDATGGSTFMRSGVYIAAADSVITNSTLFNNQANASQSSANGYVNSSGRLTMINTTVIGGGTTGGYGNFMVDNGGYLYIKNSIFANKDQGSYDLYIGSNGYLDSGGYNIIETINSGKLTPNTGDVTGDQANLNIASSLALNSTESGVPTLALSVDSIAINAGDNASYNGTSVSSADQRSAARVGLVDKGAYEYDGVISAPYTTSFYPEDDAMGIALNSNLLITFDEAVDAESGDIRLYKSDDTLIETFDVTSDISGSGTDTISINPTASFDDLTSYYVLVDATAFDDASSNSFEGISATTAWSFTTTDGTAPTIISISSKKANGTYGVGETMDINVDFSEGVTSTGDVTVTIETGAIDRTCVMNLSNSTAGTCNYTVQAGDISSDLDVTISGVIVDQAGNPMTNFVPTTSLAANANLVIDTTAPTATLTPLDDAASVAIDNNLTLTFSEAVDAETGNIILYKTSDNSTVETFDVTSDITGSGTTEIIVNPASDLAYETEYYITIATTAFDDSVGNSYVGITASTTWSFTTADTPICPTIANAATYNAYPTCGVATCSEGYTLSEGACASLGGGTSYSPPISLGGGSVDNAIGIGESKSGFSINKNNGNNFLVYINSSIGFSVNEKKYTAKIVDLNMLTRQVTVAAGDELVKLFPEESKNIAGVEITYNDLLINRIDLTIKKSEVSKKEKQATEDKKQKTAVIVTEVKESSDFAYNFSADLKRGMKGLEVLSLQKYLNNNGFIVAESGYGSPGNETESFGHATRKALIALQEARGINPALGYFGPITRSEINKGVQAAPVVLEKELLKTVQVLKEVETSMAGRAFTRNLYLGLSSSEIKNLQVYLNNKGYIVAELGYGSPGNETEIFGPATKNALIKFQKANNINPAYGYFGPLTRAFVNK